MKRTLQIFVLLAGITFLSGTEAMANFIIAEDPGGDGINLTDAKSVLASTGSVDSYIIDITVDAFSDFASGNATIKPIKDVILTTVTFSPRDDVFGDFSFRGQLSSEGSVTVTVQDNQDNPEQVFIFGPFAANTNFDRVGIIATDDETIKWIKVSSSGWKESKLFEISFNPNDTPTTPAPEPATMLLLGLGLIGLAGASRKIKR